jgi:hypothetical protein
MSRRFLIPWLLAPLSLLAQPAPAARLIDADLSNSRGATSRMYNF